jgi:hypothetical protein
VAVDLAAFDSAFFSVAGRRSYLLQLQGYALRHSSEMGRRPRSSSVFRATWALRGYSPLLRQWAVDFLFPHAIAEKQLGSVRAVSGPVRCMRLRPLQAPICRCYCGLKVAHGGPVGLPPDVDETVTAR